MPSLSLCHNDVKTRATLFADLHQKGSAFVMANAWDAGSAAILAEAGMEAIATTSAGISYSRAVPDQTMSLNDALAATQRIVQAVNLPVSMDSENLYANSCEEIYTHMQRIIETGVVGASIEDYSKDDTKPLYDLDYAVERVKAAKEACKHLGYPITLTARAECYLTGHPDPFRESVKRINLYREAGADCLFVPGIKDIETIAALVREVDGPVSVVMGLTGTPVTVSQLQDVGVARISIGGSLARATFGLVRKAAQEMLRDGSFNFAGQQIADPELNRLFSTKS